MAQSPKVRPGVNGHTNTYLNMPPTDGNHLTNIGDNCLSETNFIGYNQFVPNYQVQSIGENSVQSFIQ